MESDHWRDVVDDFIFSAHWASDRGKKVAVQVYQLPGSCFEQLELSQADDELDCSTR